MARYNSFQRTVDIDANGGLASIVTSINSKQESIKITGSQRVTIASNLTIPSNITLEIDNGSYLFVNGGVTLTLNCEIKAGRYHIFQGPGTVSGNPITDNGCLPHWWGCKGDGGTDDSVPLQTALDWAGVNNGTLYIPPNTNFRVTSNLLFYGGASITGANKRTSSITLDSVIYKNGVNWYNYFWCNFGISTLPTLTSPSTSSVKATVSTWNGILKDCRFATTNNAGYVTGDPNYVGCGIFQFHYVRDYLIENIFIDLEASSFNKVFTSMVSLQSDWTSSWLHQSGHIKGTIQKMNPHSEFGPGGINFVNAYHLRIENNYIYGSSDDPIAIIKGDYNQILNNEVYSSHGSICSYGGQGNIFTANYHERIQGHDGVWGSGFLYKTHPDGTSGPARDTIFNANIGYLPSGPTGNITMMSLMGARGGTASSNVMVSNCTTASSVVGIATGIYNLAGFVGWSDLGYYPGAMDADQIYRPRKVTLVGNRCLGSKPGSIEEGAINTAQLEGPITYSNNLAQSYNIFGPNSVFEGSNKVIASGISVGTGYQYVAGTCMTPLRKIGPFVCEARLGAPASGVLLNGDYKYYPQDAGVVAYFTAQVEPSITAGNLRVRIKKEAVASSGIWTTTDLILGTGDTKGIQDGRTYVDRVYSSTDNFQVDVIASGSFTGVYDVTTELFVIDL